MNNIEALIAQLCPDGVEFRELREIGKVCMCKRVMKHETTIAGDIPFYKIGTFGKEPDAYISKELYEDYRKRFSFPKKGEILISASGTIGRTVIYNGEPAYFQDSNIVWIKNDESKVTNKFLYYLYKTVEWKTDGGTIARLYNDKLSKTIIPFPPLPIQQEIVNILDKFTQLQAELQAELEVRRAQYEYYREQLLMVNDKGIMINGVKAEWSTLGEVGKFKYGFTDQAKKQGNVRFVRITDINENGKLRANDYKYLDLTEENKDYLISQGDVLMARTGATFGKTMLFNEDYQAVYASFLIRIRFTNKNILPAYYWQFAQSRFYWEQANKLFGGGAQPQFNANVLKLIKIPIPPIAEQNRIVAILDKFDKLVNGDSGSKAGMTHSGEAMTGAKAGMTGSLPEEIQARRKQYEYYRGKLLEFKSI